MILSQRAFPEGGGVMPTEPPAWGRLRDPPARYAMTCAMYCPVRPALVIEGGLLTRCGRT